MSDDVRAAAAAIAGGYEWRAAVEAVLAETPDVGAADLVLLFAAWDYEADFTALLAEVRARTGAVTVIGCSGQGIIGPLREIEDEAAVALAKFSLPGARLNPVRITGADVQSRTSRADWEGMLGAGVEDINGILIFTEPRFDSEALLIALSGFFPGVQVIGGVASGDTRTGRSALFLDGEVLRDGAVAVVLGGDYVLRSVVSQGCEPIGEAWTITSVSENIIETIGMKAAYQVLVETLMALEPETRERAQRNLLVGLAMDEYRDDLRRGDFLIRNLMGADREQGSLAINAYPRVGQTIQFQMRDANAADDDLRAMLDRAKTEMGGEIVGGLLCSCNGRGVGLFQTPDHDATAVAASLGPVPLAGFFCNGEIGAVGRRIFLHGFTASLGLIVRK